MFKKSRLITTAAAAVLAAGTLTGCQAEADHTHGHGHDHAKTSHESSKASLHGHDLWVKSAAKGTMSAIFGNLHSDVKDADITITGVTSPVAAKAEIHEVVNGKMQPAAGGLRLAPGGEVDLEPGGLHLMLLNLQEDLLAGNKIEFTLELADGTKVPLHATVRDYSGANEDYDHDHGGHHDHDHDHDHDHSDHDDHTGHDH